MHINYYTYKVEFQDRANDDGSLRQRKDKETYTEEELKSRVPFTKLSAAFKTVRQNKTLTTEE